MQGVSRVCGTAFGPHNKRARVSRLFVLIPRPYCKTGTPLTHPDFGNVCYCLFLWIIPQVELHNKLRAREHIMKAEFYPLIGAAHIE